MTLKRHQKFRLELEKKWSEKWFKFVTSHHICGLGNISENPNITMEFIEAHPEYKWNWSNVSYNPNLTIEFIGSHPQYPWDWRIISKKS